MNAKQAQRFYNLLVRVRGPPKPQLALHRKLSSDGRNLIFRIPKEIERALQLTGNDKVNVWVDGNKVMVEKVGA